MGNDDQRGRGFAGYLTVGEAAKCLRVSSSTLRNWDRAGKLRARRHPMNGYRLYRRGDVEKIVVELDANE